jgi:prolyl 4-hydroxylase
MEPGDLVLYESHSVIHGRPFKLRGNYYANIFVHFEPLGLPLDMPEAETAEGYDLDFPPYLIADSSWMPEWQESNPNGWTRLKDSTALVINGDLRTLQYLGKLNPSKLHEHDGSAAEWRPIHEAARQGNVDILKFLIEEQGANVNELCKVAGGMTPLGLVHKYLGWNHPASEYLLSVGGVKVRRKLVAPDAAAGEEEAESDEEQDQGEL